VTGQQKNLLLGKSKGVPKPGGGKTTRKGQLEGTGELIFRRSDKFNIRGGTGGYTSRGSRRKENQPPFVALGSGVQNPV